MNDRTISELVLTSLVKDHEGEDEKSRTNWKCVSLDVDPFIAAWCACRCESLRMISVEGVKACAS